MPGRPSKSLDVVPNPHTDRDYEVAMTAPEFTCVCPMTGQPDFATIRIRYVPAQHLAELNLVDHRARDCHLTPHDREERDRRGLVRQTGQHDAPARAYQRERVVHRRRGPRRLDHEIDALAAGKPARRLFQWP